MGTYLTGMDYAIRADLATYHAIGHAYGPTLKSVMVAGMVGSDSNTIWEICTVTGNRTFEELLDTALHGRGLRVDGPAVESVPWDYGEQNKRIAWRLSR